jgi:urease accessory protein
MNMARAAGTTMATATNTEPEPHMASAHTLLQLMWLASPALPVGGFSYSEGLEAAIESSHVTSEAQAREWLLAQLQLGLARNELAVAYQAFGAWQRHDGAQIAALNAWVTQTRESSELRQQTEQMGRSMVEWLKNKAPRPSPHPHPLPEGEGVNTPTGPDPRVATLAALQPAPTWPIAFALAAAQTGASAQEALLSLAFGWAENMVQASLKAVPLGQSAGQRILASLSAAIPAAVEQAMQLAPYERQAFTPMLAILSAQHETQYSRLFRS